MLKTTLEHLTDELIAATMKAENTFSGFRYVLRELRNGRRGSTNRV